jgi:hypothetical protein
MNLVFSILTETCVVEQSRRCSELLSTWQDVFYLPFHMARDQVKEASHIKITSVKVGTTRKQSKL